MKKITTLLMTMLFVMTAMFANAAEYSVYFDNSVGSWSKVNVYGWNGIDFGAWPGSQVTETTAEGYYKVTVTADADPADSGAKIIFNNGSGTQTADLVWVTNAIYTKNGNTGELYGGGSVEMYDFKIYFDNSTAGWSKVNVYGWNGVNFGNWPGTQITETTAEGYYVVTVTDAVSPAGASIIFNDGSSQTADLVWVDNAIYNQNGNTGNLYGGGTVTPDPEPETETLTYNVTVPAGTPACYIAGEMNEWSFTAMTMVDETHYTITLDNVTKAMKYKYTASESWDNVEMQADGVTDVVDRTYNENDVVAAWKGLTTDPVEPETETLTYNVTVPAGTPACYIAGEMNSWSFTAMTMVDETHYTITLDNVTKAMKYKYTASESWDNVEMQADGVTDVVDRTYNENDVVAAWKGLTTDPVEPEYETLTYNVTVPAGTPACYIAGEMNEWSFTAMTMVDETHYTITLDNVTKAMKYKYTASESWDNVEMQADGVTDVVDRTYNENDVVAAWKGLTTDPVEPEYETLTYNVTVPAGTPACYIVGDFNEWGAFVPMTMVDETHYTITIENTTKTSGYKYACGEDWKYEEVTAEGGQVANRNWSESDVVAAWKSTPSDEPEILETLTYNVTVPVGTYSCFIAGDMNEWSFTEMIKVDDTHFTITLENVSRTMGYKYACGADWEYVEMQADGVSDVGNRTYSENDVVAAWKNTWSSVADVEAADVKVYGANGVLCIRTAEEETFAVYNAQGMLVDVVTVDGAADINLARGLYIVNGVKVVVR